MAPTEAAEVVTLTPGDIAGCLALSAEAGWNQTADDWALFMRHGCVLGVRGDDGAPVATGAVLPYAGGFAWIGMVLVTAARRRQRLGTQILQACCAEVAGRALVAVLDATPAGEHVYRPLGFEPVCALTRWQGHGGGAMPAGVRAMASGDLATVVALDAAAFGAARPFLIDSLYARASGHAFVTAAGTGFVLARPGRLATQIGPVVASDAVSAIALISAALSTISGPVFVDLADHCGGLADHLRGRGFVVQRPFLRMALARHDPFGDPAGLYAVTGPEFG